ncbi:uncharacterized protein LOC108914794 [Anoplophora glabripennis]|uniref:uncharacterized protein LOC108914794 n=1 Tax=Anoplophora glabripennis TaxID=217634 RepID=UPI000873DDD5|nr:uncharacterized protein LOC108914794 [Anoplophora glabripennis]
MCSSLSEEARLELQEMCDESGPAIDAAINEAISDEQLNLAIDIIIDMDASVPSSSKAAKRKILQDDDDDDFQNPPPSHEAPALPSRSKNMHLARKNIRPSSSVRSLSPTLSTSSSSTTSDDSEDWLEIINEELQLRAEFRQRVDGKMNNGKKIKSSEDLIFRIKGEKKSLRVHRETLREQIRLLDAQEGEVCQ